MSSVFSTEISSMTERSQGGRNQEMVPPINLAVTSETRMERRHEKKS